MKFSAFSTFSLVENRSSAVTKSRCLLVISVSATRVLCKKRLKCFMRRLESVDSGGSLTKHALSCDKCFGRILGQYSRSGNVIISTLCR